MTYEDAPAKVNLALHITGQRDDGYHLLESIVVFTEFGDRIRAEISDADSFSVIGPFSAEMQSCPTSSNLVVKARNILMEFASSRGIDVPPVALMIEKNVPLASGLGGGSADAAATLRLLQKLWQLEIDDHDLASIGLILGADVPMCLVSSPLIASGIGEGIEPISTLPSFALVLANPMVEVSTPAIFAKLSSKENPAFDHTELPDQLEPFITLLRRYRNDLQSPAIDVSPEIKTCLDALGSTGPLFHRMSGSGASCFAIFQDLTEAKQACDKITRIHPNWFVTATALRG